MTPIALIQTLNLNDIPDAVKEQAKLSILDLIEFARWGGYDCPRSFANMQHRNLAERSPCYLMAALPVRRAALAAGMTTIALMGMTGLIWPRGIAGVPRNSCDGYEQQISGREVLLATWAMNLRTRGDGTTCNRPRLSHIRQLGRRYGGSGRGLHPATQYGSNAPRLGIAEYHGPRSQMMRCIDHPTMLKDGAGWDPWRAFRQKNWPAGSQAPLP